MNEETRPTVTEMLGNLPLITAALQRGVREALHRHAQAGNPVATWKDGQVVWLQPGEIFALLAQYADEVRG